MPAEKTVLAKSLPSMPMTSILSTCLFLIGMSAAAIAPYRAITAIDTLGMSNTLYALVMTLGSIGTALGSLVMGYFADKMSDRRWLVMLSAIMGMLAYGLIYLFPTQLIYIIAICAILPLGGSLFSQTFAYARVYYDKQQPERSEFMVSFLRTLFSLAWVIMPPLAGWVASRYTVLDLFAAAALAHVLFTLIFGLLLRDGSTKIGTTVKQTSATPDETQEAFPVSKIVGISGVLCIRIAMFLHLTVIPLALIHDFSGTLATVGLNASIAAGLEIPFMLAWGWAAMRMPKEHIISISALLFALYLILVFKATSVTQVLWLQSINAVATAALLSITISYMQEAIKGRVGLSTSLMDVVSVTASLLAAALFGFFSSEESYRQLFAIASVLSLVGAIVIATSRVGWRHRAK